MSTFMKFLACLAIVIYFSQLVIICEADDDVTYNFTALNDDEIVSFGNNLVLKPKDEFKEYGKELLKRYYSAARVFDVVNATADRAKSNALESNQTITEQDPLWKALNETIKSSHENLSKLNVTMTAFINEADKRADIKAFTKAFQAGAKLIGQAFKGGKDDKKKDKKDKDSHSSKPKDVIKQSAPPPTFQCPSVPQCICPSVPQHCSCPPVQQCHCPSAPLQCNCPTSRPAVYSQPSSKDKTKPPLNTGRPQQHFG